MHPTPADLETPPAVTRRHMLHTLLALGATASIALPRAARAVGGPVVATPSVSLGPFYPAQKPTDSDADLTQVAGRPQRAAGTILYTSGRVLDLQGRPLPNATLEMWQANAFGRYHHPGDSDASGKLDPNFQAYARIMTDAEGRYRIKTIKPPPYGGRTPHLHYIVASERTRLTTQMFFDGDPGNDRDFLYRNLAAADKRAATGQFGDRTAGMEPDAIVTVWDIVLQTA